MRTAFYAALIVATTLFFSGCNRKPAAGHLADSEAHHAEHTAFHGGCLNAIGSCDNGHAEVKVQDGVLTLWFVGGGNDTDHAIRVPNPAITLAVKTGENQPARTLRLEPKPNALAEEKVGDCATFVGQADWLKGIKEFGATGTVTFKGTEQAFRIDYPAGYDPDDEPAPAAPSKPAQKGTL